MLVTVVALVLGTVTLVLWIRSRRRVKQREAELASLSEIGTILLGAGEDLDTLAESIYLEAAKLVEHDSFQMGLFEDDGFRPLIHIQNGENVDIRTLPLDPAGGLSHVRQTGQSIIWPLAKVDPTDPSVQPKPPHESHASSAMYIPIRVGENIVAALAIECHRPGVYHRGHLRSLDILARMSAAALTILSLNSEIKHRSESIVLLGDISRRLLSLRPISESFAAVATLVSQAFSPCLVRIFELSDQDLVIMASASTKTELEGEDLRYPSELARLASRQGRTLCFPSSEEGVDPVPAYSSRCAEIAAPLKVENRLLGILHIMGQGEGAFPTDQVVLAEMLAAQLAIAALEARNFAQFREESWIKSVLLEVARHAARSGSTEEALQSVLQLTTLVASTPWAILLIRSEIEDVLQVGPMAGLLRSRQEQISGISLDPQELGLHPPFHDSSSPFTVALPEILNEPLESSTATAFILGDGTSLLGCLLVDEAGSTEARSALLAGIAHQLSLRLEVDRLASKAAAQRALEREISMARDIQVSFLPSQVPHHAGWEIGVAWHAAREVAGDYYDFIPLEPGQWGTRWGIAIADVAGKGVPASLFMAMTRTLLRSVAMSHIDPGLTLRRMNRLLTTDNSADLFVSLFYAVWEPEFGRLSYANAGHNPPFYCPRHSQPRWLTDHGLVMGVQADTSYATHWLEIAEGDLLVMYTDGVTEAPNEENDLFGEDRLEQLICGMRERKAQMTADQIVEEVKRFTSMPLMSDDITVVTLRRAGISTQT